MKYRIFQENELSIFGKGAIYILLALAFISSAFNIIHGVVPSPSIFAVVLVGFFLFLIAKISVLSKGIKFSFGTGHMSPTMANIYRVGYWLMLVGILCTFIG